MENYKRGLTAGIPIALGYLSVSFTFGIMAVSYGLSWWQAVLISMTTGIISRICITQLTVNVKYSLFFRVARVFLKGIEYNRVVG